MTLKAPKVLELIRETWIAAVAKLRSFKSPFSKAYNIGNRRL